jgi:hypothetical protein
VHTSVDVFEPPLSSVEVLCDELLSGRWHGHILMNSEFEHWPGSGYHIIYIYAVTSSSENMWRVPGVGGIRLHGAGEQRIHHGYWCLTA